MMQNLPRLEARQALNDRGYSSKLDAGGMYDLVLAATGDEKLASEMSSLRGLDRMRKGLPA